LHDDTAAVTRLADYEPSNFAIDDIALSFQLDPVATRVHARYHVRRVAGEATPLVLDGIGLTLEHIYVDGTPLDTDAYRQESECLVITAPPDSFVLEIDTLICPGDNTKLEGLYFSGGRFCTQCESQGFRHIAFALDRPDVLSRFVVRMEADLEQYPTLLSNGDPIEAGPCPGGRHFAVWRDPYPKPCYLFALVAGTFDVIGDEYVTMSGRKVALAIHVDQGDAQRALYALDALRRAMAWDERVFGREYDLAGFHIVAMREFNMGAMENKGLNIFNSTRLLADFETATDANFEDIERVVAHEYFHNWTGNRITIRDWFQLCLKEGLTNYRDQEFSSDQRSRSVRRIKDVQSLRETQFPEDAGPLAHPVRPEQYLEIRNFYTTTVYKKGAELIRVLRAIIGPEQFARGMDLYFKRWDGQAVTLEQFVECFEIESGRNLGQFLRWYTQAGTPHLISRGEYQAETRTYRLTVSQTTAPTPGQVEKVALPIPLKVGFIGHDGTQLTARLKDADASCGEFALVLDRESASFVFEEVASPPIPAILRGYCAPVSIDDGLGIHERLVQMAHDPDLVTRWAAGQDLLMAAIWAEAEGSPEMGPAIGEIASALAREVDRLDRDGEFVAVTLRVPSLASLIQLRDVPDVEALFQARNKVRRLLALALEPRLVDLAAQEGEPGSSTDLKQVARRALKNASLELLASLGALRANLIAGAFQRAGNMTESMGALEALSHIEGDWFDAALGTFLERWHDRPLVVDKWFSVQAAAPRNDAASRVLRLARHPLFSLTNPNRVRSVYDAFAVGNLRGFHASDGSGYALVGAAIEKLDAINPGVAARLAKTFESWRRFDAGRNAKARAVLEGLLTPALSKNVRDIVARTLN
jgi:aminopeptidase N